MQEFELIEHIAVVDATTVAKKINFPLGVWELSANVTSGAGLALTVQHRPSLGASKPAPVTLPVGVPYNRHHKSLDKKAAVMSDIEFTVPLGAIAVFQMEAMPGYAAPVVTDVT